MTSAFPGGPIIWRAAPLTAGLGPFAGRTVFLRFPVVSEEERALLAGAVQIDLQAVNTENEARDWPVCVALGRRAADAFVAEMTPHAELAGWSGNFRLTIANAMADQLYSLVNPLAHFQAVAPPGAAVAVHAASPAATHRTVAVLRSLGFDARAAAPAGEPPPPLDARVEIEALARNLHISQPPLDHGLDDRPTLLALVRLDDDLHRTTIFPVLRQVLGFANVVIANVSPRALPEIQRMLAGYGLSPDGLHCDAVTLQQAPVLGLNAGHPFSTGAIAAAATVRAEISPPVAGYWALDHLLERLAPALFRIVAEVRAHSTALGAISQAYAGVFACPGRGILAMTLARGLALSKRPSFEIQSATFTRRFLPPLAETVFAIDAHTARLFGAQDGMSAERVRIVGSPRLDWRIRHVRGRDPAEIKARLGRRPGEELAVFFCQPFEPPVVKALIDLAIKGLALSGRSIRLVIRPHPRDGLKQRAVYGQARKRVRVSVEINEAGDVYDWMAAADWVLTYCSGAGIEAAALGRPVIALNPFDRPPPADLVKMGVARPARAPEELRDLIANGAWSSDLPAMQTDGRSAERAASLIHRAIRAGRPSRETF